MLTLDATVEKLLTFQVEIDGVGCDELGGFVRFMHEGIEYGFPAIIESDRITTVISPLSEIFPTLKSGTIVNARLDIISQDRIFTPWEDEMKISKPVTITAELAGSGGSKDGVSIKARVSESKKSPRLPKEKSKQQLFEEKKSVLKQSLKNVSEEDIYRYMDKAGTRTKHIQDLVYEQASSNAKNNFEVLKNVVKLLKKKKR